MLVRKGLRIRSPFHLGTLDAQWAGVKAAAQAKGGPAEVTDAIDVVRRKLLAAAFRMPSVQTMVSRKSSITNAFVNAVVPTIPPTDAEIEEALKMLGMDAEHVCCAYCGDAFTEWDHLRPLVVNRRPTGFVSEIANLVPACGKCNQSKGNQPWKSWMLGKAKGSPTGRKKVEGLPDRVSRLEKYEQWRAPVRIDFESILGRDTWEHYWSLCEKVNEEMKQCQAVADALRARIATEIARK